METAVSLFRLSALGLQRENSHGGGLTGGLPIRIIDRLKAHLGRSQAVRHRVLIPAFLGSIPSAPAK
jgi:hypothetical protein